MASERQSVDLNFGGDARAVGLLDPALPQDAATKAYVDAHSGDTSEVESFAFLMGNT